MANAKKTPPKTDKEHIDINKVVALQDELTRLREEHPEFAAPQKKNLFEKVAGAWMRFDDKHNHEYPVNRKTYCWLCLLGPFGVHHFYARHWVKGLIYLAICWSGISIGMTVIDWMVAFPKKPDENGMILI